MLKGDLQNFGRTSCLGSLFFLQLLPDRMPVDDLAMRLAGLWQELGLLYKIHSENDL